MKKQIVSLKDRQWIDKATYQELLARWRHAPLGDTMFIAETGDYYSKVMKEKKAELTNDEQVRVSKNIGW